MTRQQVWIGLAELQQKPGAGVLLDRNFAYAQVLTWASSEAEHRKLARRYVDELGFDLLRMGEVDSLSERLELYSVEQDLLAKANFVETTGQPAIGPLHTWIAED